MFVNSRQLAGFCFSMTQKWREERLRIFLALYPEKGDEKEISYFAHSNSKIGSFMSFVFKKFGEHIFFRCSWIFFKNPT
jgi:hypothetical protein